MEQDNLKEHHHSKQKVGGYQIGNLLSSDQFLTQNKVPRLSFDIFDIVTVDDREILKLKFPKIKNLMVRFMKYNNDDGYPALVFDMVDIEKKSSDKGPPRKFYALNAKGKKELQYFWEKWGFITSKIDELKERI